MAISYHWDEQDHTIIYWHYEGEWDWEEYVRLTQDARLLIQNRRPERIDSIADFRNSEEIPNGALAHLIPTMKQVPENFGIAVVMGRGATFNMLVDILWRTLQGSREQIYVAMDDSDARKIIENNRRRAR